MKDIIRHIININLGDEYAYQKLLDIFLNIKTFPVYRVPIMKTRSCIYRTRPNEDDNFVKFSELENPPKESVLNFGRVNKPFQF